MESKVEKEGEYLQIQGLQLTGFEYISGGNICISYNVYVK